MGNICRSPTAEGMFRHLLEERDMADRFVVDSAGTHAYHVGDPPDPRAIEAAAARGIDLRGIRARQVKRDDFERFDLLLAMDDDNMAILARKCPGAYQDRLQRLLAYAPDTRRRDVPDPYYGSGNGFEEVLDLVEAASRGLLDALTR